MLREGNLTPVQGIQSTYSMPCEKDVIFREVLIKLINILPILYHLLYCYKDIKHL